MSLNKLFSHFPPSTTKTYLLTQNILEHHHRLSLVFFGQEFISRKWNFRLMVSWNVELFGTKETTRWWLNKPLLFLTPLLHRLLFFFCTRILDNFTYIKMKTNKKQKTTSRSSNSIAAAENDVKLLNFYFISLLSSVVYICGLECNDRNDLTLIKFPMSISHVFISFLSACCCKIDQIVVIEKA